MHAPQDTHKLCILLMDFVKKIGKKNCGSVCRRGEVGFQFWLNAVMPLIKDHCVIAMQTLYPSTLWAWRVTHISLHQQVLGHLFCALREKCHVQDNVWEQNRKRKSSTIFLERVILSQTKIGTVLKRTLGKLQRDEVEHLWIFLSTWTELYV